MLGADDVIATARMLRAQAAALRTAARATRASVAADVRSHRRVFLLVRGASDEASETGVLRCPHCQSERVKACGSVTATGGILKISHRCEACDNPFVFVRATRELFDRSSASGQG